MALHFRSAGRQNRRIALHPSALRRATLRDGAKIPASNRRRRRCVEQPGCCHRIAAPDLDALVLTNPRGRKVSQFHATKPHPESPQSRTTEHASGPPQRATAPEIARCLASSSIRVIRVVRGSPPAPEPGLSTRAQPLPVVRHAPRLLKSQVSSLRPDAQPSRQPYRTIPNHPDFGMVARFPTTKSCGSLAPDHKICPSPPASRVHVGDA